jgi:hypothetical protein
MSDVLTFIFWGVLAFTAMHYTLVQGKVIEPWRIVISVLFAVFFVIFTQVKSL